MSGCLERKQKEIMAGEDGRLLYEIKIRIGTSHDCDGIKCEANFILKCTFEHYAVEI